jgi:hypothetical protein
MCLDDICALALRGLLCGIWDELLAAWFQMAAFRGVLQLPSQQQGMVGPAIEFPLQVLH